MRRPLVLASTLAAQLAVGTLALAPPATAQTPPDIGLDEGSVEPDDLATGPAPDDLPSDPVDPVDPVDPAPVRTGRSDAPPVAVPIEAPVEMPGAAPASPTLVRSGRLDSAARVAESTDAPSSGRNDDSDPRSVDAPGRPSKATTKPSSPNIDRPSAPAPTVPAGAAVPTATDQPEPAPTASSHVVVPGDHLWAIAAQQVAAASGRAPSDLTAGDVVTYWVQLCMTNRPKLRSGHPSLIYPGEVIDLPPTG